ncbi:ABC transporter substrate-binding protein [Terracoccus luteus]|jgi:peptide/nickel transport system substrate-binding protein|uniref:Peptide/nickel transport system substrate-binding protein n=1 Tax=Terracoccus luteus TaxID=53356 RepID=A0A495Y0I9_9MICO|nr:ABC transporter substrate-binding protein [Terracoccus luteus]MBB2985903.1 peptide/nickel transport system substrate-binding protein [Terracoccus luteus]MCP2171555.1 peptide/nickel transport system substrate-binding protein [Terracoccus luteus]RKT78654.1 peptide/nickel transport system substrate-binding protein [Terracoccus luteus]
MKNRRILTVAATAALALGLSACAGGGGGGSTGSGTGGGNGGSGSAGADAAIGKIVNASDAKGGTLRFGMAGDWDSIDPGDTYYGLSWNFLRNYARTLVVFKAAPGEGGTQLVPDLATSLGKPSDGNKTWTYTLRDNLKYQDGSPITSKDVKYAVARQLDKDTFPNGPTYFNDFLADVPEGYSVYKDKNLDDLKSIETPDDKTIVFKLKTGFSGFDYFAQLPATAPVPQAKDTGSKYKETIVSSGPYKFTSYQAGKSYELDRNESYDPATDPDSGRKALPDKLTVELGLNAADVDQRLQAGDLDVDIAGTGVQAESQGKILADPTLKAQTDNASAARTWFTVINSDVAPLDNIDCRKAVVLAYDKTGYQRAYGGKTGGDIATSLMPPNVPGHEDIDLYDFKAKPQGDPDAAKAALAKCGQPNGFDMNISYRAERPKEKAVAESLQQSLAKVGINLSIKSFPTADYTKLYAGKPDYAKTNKLGLIVYGWGADWPDGFGFLSQIVDSRVIRPSGNTNLGIKIPAVDTLVDQALAENDAAKRDAIWGQADKTVMENAAVVPGVWAKGLLYRPSNLTNVFVNDGFTMYDYAAMGTSRK